MPTVLQVDGYQVLRATMPDGTEITTIRFLSGEDTYDYPLPTDEAHALGLALTGELG